jgi:predicted esterase
VDGPFYNHYTRGSSPGSSIHEAFDHTKSFIAKEGPFDVVIGFSQGAALAASLIIHQSKTNPSEPLFRAAVFICGAAPWDSTGLQHIAPQPDTYPIAIPTANIVGKADALFPESVSLFELCEPAKATFYDHGSKHMVPFDMKNTEEMIRVIEETVAKAMRG